MESKLAMNNTLNDNQEQSTTELERQGNCNELPPQLKKLAVELFGLIDQVSPWSENSCRFVVYEGRDFPVSKAEIKSWSEDGMISIASN